MAKYYYCNGTTKKHLPCQQPVQIEGGKCPFHRGGGGGPGPGKPIFSLLKSAVDGMIWLHAANQAIPFLADIIKRLIAIVKSDLNLQVEDLNELTSLLKINEQAITERIDNMKKDGISEIVMISNIAVSLVATASDDDNDNDNDNTTGGHMSAHA